VWAAYNLASNVYTLYLPRREPRVYFIGLPNLNLQRRDLGNIAAGGLDSLPRAAACELRLRGVNGG